MHEVQAELQLSSSPLYALWLYREARDLCYPVSCLETFMHRISRKKNSRFCQPQTAKKKLEIDYKNLEISEICTDEKSRDLCFSRNINLEKIYLYDGPNLRKNTGFLRFDTERREKLHRELSSL
jgi:hypothetical protein